MTEHRVRWYGVLPGNEPWAERLVPRTRLMAGRDWGWDVICSCGWESRTGGGIQADVRRKLEDHRSDAEFEATHVFNGREWVETEVVP